MGLGSSRWWQSLEQWRAIAFLLGGIVFGVDTALVASHLAAGTEPGPFGQGLVGAAWTASFIGLLGMYPSLIDRNGWLVRTAAVCATIGGLTMAVMSLASFGYAAGVLPGALSNLVMYFLPGVFIGIVLGFGLFGVATLRTETYVRSVSLLFLILVLTFLTNIGSGMAGVRSMMLLLGVVAVLTLTKLGLGYLFWTEGAQTSDRNVESPSDSVA